MPNIQLQFRRGTAAQWAAANPTLASGEMGIETDTNQFKIGNGSSAWNSLSYGGIQGPAGSTGATGAAGAAGPGVATGGTVGQLLVKNSSTNYDTSWTTYAESDPVFTSHPAHNVTSGDIAKLSNLSGTNSGDQNLFSTVAVSGQSNVVADSTSDTLTLVAGQYVSITTNASTDAVTIATTGVQKAITSGTAAPSGGSDGDIYLQYT